MVNSRKTFLDLGLACFICLGACAFESRADSTAQLTLTNGWNLISLPLQPADTRITTVLASIRGAYNAVWTYSNGHWYGFNPSVPGLDDLTNLEAGQAYWIDMRKIAVLKITGLPPVNAANDLAGRNLTPGWNLLGYSSSRSNNASDAFSVMASQLDLAAADAGSGSGWLVYQPGNSNNTLGALPPYRGVWAHVNTNSSWIAPNYRGTLVNAESGNPVPGATVTLGGIEAQAKTDAQGAFIVAGVSDDSAQLLTAAAPSYTSVTTMINVSDSTGPSTNSPTIAPLASPFVADVLVPQNNSIWLQAGACSQPGILVKGYTALQDQSNFLYDIVFVIDTSGSTARPTGFDLNGDGQIDSVFEAEVEACRQLTRTLTDTNHIRFGLVKFGRYHTKNAPNGSISDGPIETNETRIVQPLTSDPVAFDAALNTVVSEGANGGTDTAAGIGLGIDALLQAPPVGADYRVTPIRHIVLLTDGIPTLPIENGSTQQRGDRLATIAAAQAAAASNIMVHPVVIDPSAFAERKLTTMPTVQAITGVPGDMARINTNDFNQLPDILSHLDLTSIPAVTVVDHTTGTNWNITVEPNGWFEALLPVSIGTNNWEFQFSSGDVNSNQTITRLVTFVVYPTNSVLDVVGLTASNTPVSQLPYLNGPTGTRLHDTGPEHSLLYVLTNKVPQARVLPGVESFHTSSGNMTLQFIFKGAGYNSDVGYFLFDPANPPRSAAEALAGVGPTNILLNSGNVPFDTLNVTGFVNTIQVPAGVSVGLFMVPNGRLADAQNPPPLCGAFPIALSASSLANVSPGTVLSNIWNGSQSGNFGWLSWTGDSSDPTLVTSLTLPGDSSTYVNPDYPTDHELVVGDWVSARPGVSNSKGVRTALNTLIGSTIVVPVWDQARGSGSKAAYHISAFANVQIVSYQLSSQNVIAARFLGFANCGRRVNAPLFTLSSLNPGQFSQAMSFYDPVGQQIVCAFEDIDIMSQNSDLDFQDLVFTVKPIDPLPQRTDCFDP